MVSSYDGNYGKKYSKRNQDKKDALMPYFRDETVLDVGCNNGYLCSGVLEKFSSARCTGIELKKQPLNKDLLENPRFSFLQANVISYEPQEEFDVVVYNAVHHHVVGTDGVVKALDVVEKLVSASKRALVFETGLMIEKGSFYWKTALRKAFSNDLEHLEAVFDTVGPRLREVLIVGEFPIHGVVRPLYWIDLEPK